MKANKFIDQPNPADGDELRAAMRFWATGVSVVTSTDGTLSHGMTVNSFTSVSLDPPIILVSLEQSTRTHKLVEASGVFGVTILSSEQEAVSNRFAGKDSENQDRFAGLDTERLQTGCPFIRGGLAYVDCRVMSTIAAGVNTIFVAQVVAVSYGAEGAENGPLLYYRRGYRKVAG